MKKKIIMKTLPTIAVLSIIFTNVIISIAYASVSVSK